MKSEHGTKEDTKSEHGRKKTQNLTHGRKKIRNFGQHGKGMRRNGFGWPEPDVDDLEMDVDKYVDVSWLLHWCIVVALRLYDKKAIICHATRSDGHSNSYYGSS